MTKVAVFGCLHGMLNEMFDTVLDYEKQNNVKVDLILVCGDCQTIRHQDDLKCLAVPNRFKRLGDFHEYYSGKKRVPKLTIFVGGNHEASNYLMTLPYGGWVCDNFYYLGYAGVINYRGMRIAGVSGIYKYHDCNRGHYETMPLDDQSVRSIYHSRRLEIFRLQLLSNLRLKSHPIDIFLSHDWPARVYDHGDVQQLLRFKPIFRSDIESRNGLGNPMTESLLYELKPRRWFAAHLHCRFYAKVEHGARKSNVNQPANRDEAPSNHCTEFLSLSKIEKGRRFVEFIDIIPLRNATTRDHPITEEGSLSTGKPDANPDGREVDDSSEEHNIFYDAEWLTILKKTTALEANSSLDPTFLSSDKAFQEFRPSDEEIQKTVDLMEKTGGMLIKRNFRMTEPVIYNREDGSPPSKDTNRYEYFPNPQNEELCSRLEFVSRLHQACEDSKSVRNERIDSFPKNQRRDRFSNNPRARGRYNYDRASTSHHTNRGGRHVTTEEAQTTHPGRDTGVHTNPNKKMAFNLDEEGCLPFYVDRKGEI